MTWVTYGVLLGGWIWEVGFVGGFTYWVGSAGCGDFVVLGF